MPLYDFQCDACEHRFERILQKYSDPNPETCPKCGKGPVTKLPSSPAIQFKGSGFYITDYAKKSSPEAGAAKSSGDGGSSSASSGDTKSESKSDTKSDTKSESKSESKPAETKSSDNKSSDSKS